MNRARVSHLELWWQIHYLLSGKSSKLCFPLLHIHRNDYDSVVFLCRLPPHRFLTRRKRLWVTSALPWTPLSTGFGGDRTASTSFCSKNIVMRENQDQFYLFMARSPPHLEIKLNNIFISSFCSRKSRYLNYYHIHDLSNENFHLKKGKQSHQVPILPFF